MQSTREMLLDALNKALEANPSLTKAGLGHQAIGDTNLFRRLENGGDITTRKLDAIMAFLRELSNQQKGENNG